MNLELSLFSIMLCPLPQTPSPNPHKGWEAGTCGPDFPNNK